MESNWTIATYQTGPDELITILFWEHTIRVSQWIISEERVIRRYGRIYANEVDAAARYVVECARYRLAEVAFQGQAAS